MREALGVGKDKWCGDKWCGVGAGCELEIIMLCPAEPSSILRGRLGRVGGIGG